MPTPAVSREMLMIGIRQMVNRAFARKELRGRQVRQVTLRATASVLTGGPERDRLWDQHVARLPHFAAYPAKARRIIPVVRLTPVAGAADR